MKPENVYAAMTRIMGPVPGARQLRCGPVAWEVIKASMPPLTYREGFAGLSLTLLMGMPVHIDDDMSPCAWKVMEGEAVIMERDFAPGFTHAIWDPERQRIIAFNPLPDLPMPPAPERIERFWLNDWRREP